MVVKLAGRPAALLESRESSCVILGEGAARLDSPPAARSLPRMDHLDRLESQSVFIFREAFAKIDRLAMLWSLGKDSNVMVWLARKAFFGRVPFPLALLDTDMEMDEVYAFRDRIAREWDLEVINHPCPPEEQMDKTSPPATRAAMRKGSSPAAFRSRYCHVRKASGAVSACRTFVWNWIGTPASDGEVICTSRPPSSSTRAISK